MLRRTSAAGTASAIDTASAIGTASAAGPRARLARLATEILAPAVIVTVLMLALGWHGASRRLLGLGHGAIGALFESIVPFGYIVRQVRSGALTDHHVGRREQRRRPLVFAMCSVLVGIVVLVAMGANRELIAGAAAGQVGLLVSVVVSHWWKMSIHTATAGGAAVMVTLVFGVPGLLAWPLVALAGWSRVVLGDHTVAQVAVGTAVGSAVVAAVFAPFA